MLPVDLIIGLAFFLLWAAWELSAGCRECWLYLLRRRRASKDETLKSLKVDRYV